MGTKLWFKIQSMVASDVTPSSSEGIIDRIHDNYYVKLANEYFIANDKVWRYSTIFTTFLFDLFLVINMYDMIFYGNLAPYFMLMSAVILRHMCVTINRLPPPPKLHWEDPGFPTIFMTYGTVHDFFFSGHTTFSLITGLNIMYWNTFTMILTPIFILSEILFVLVSNGHYTMDVYAGIMTYLGLKYIFSIFGF